MDLHIAQTLFEAIDAALDGTIANGTAKVMLVLGGVFGSAWALQFSIKAMQWLLTGLNQAMEDILWSMLRVAIVVSIAFNVGWYVRVVVPFVTNMPVWMGGVLAGSEGAQTNQVDLLLNNFFDALMKLYDALSFSVLDDFSVIALAVTIILLVVVGGVPFLSVCIATLVLLKVSTTCMLVVGPIFIAFALFEETRRFFWGWISVVGGFMLANVLFSVVVGLALSFINTFVLKAGAVETTWADAVSIFFYFSAFTVLATMLPDQAAGVMGGVSSGSSGLRGLLGKGTGLGPASRMAGAMARGLGKRLMRNRNRIQ